MRIRKHAKISPLTHVVSSLNLPTYLCHLNQSPWDVATFHTLPQPQQEGDDEEHPFSSSNILPSPSPPPLRLSFEFDEYDTYPPNGIFSYSNAASQSAGLKKCYHHVSKFKHHSSFAKKQPQPARTMAALSSPRRKKALVSASIAHEMYLLCTGFGPLWGKKRGPGRVDPSTNVTGGLGSDIDNNVGCNDPSVGRVNGSRTAEEGEEEDDAESNGRKKKARKLIKIRSLKSLT